MPYLDGVKVTNDQWMDAKTGHGVGWREAFGWQDGDESPSEISQAELEPIPPPDDVAPPRTRRERGKKAQAEAALLAVTGLDIDLDEADETLIDLSGIPEDEDA